jgi:hypothetical protein
LLVQSSSAIRIGRSVVPQTITTSRATSRSIARATTGTLIWLDNQNAAMPSAVSMASGCSMK